MKIKTFKTRGLDNDLIADLHSESVVKRIQAVLKMNDALDNVKLCDITHFLNQGRTSLLIVTDDWTYDIHFDNRFNELRHCKSYNYTIQKMNQLITESKQLTMKS
ncbi:hypothetical protein MUN88_14155 [Gracilibacillus caseinilyticus]|uniref:Uncharacterized protein n=1 Tax=Gracilibacillus caseinilyticus TaxID=2932256 RepID=A0ABY4ETA7_9BACI|nr:hypothetical protein [Gracilibacillus caseinilyticus]UOQ47210.1 hypothetical protein MUN88_14155 [Gracilibacillus caseinilyticus]